MEKVENHVTNPPQFCFCLGLSKNRCDVMIRDNQDSVWKQTREMVAAWFEDTLDPTWDAIVKTLKCMKKKKAAKLLADETGVDFDRV